MFGKLYQSDLLEISRFACAGHDSEGEEVSWEHEIVMPLDGIFMRRDSFGQNLGDSKHMLFFNAQQPHEISHPVGFGETCLIIRMAEKPLLEMLHTIAPHLENQAEQPFEFASLRLNTEQQWQKYRLLSILSHAEGMALEDFCMAWLFQLFQALYEQDKPVRPMNRQQREAVHAVQIFLNQAYCSTLTLETIAAQVHYSPFMLCRLFKQAFGLSIHQYLSELRLSAALKALQDTPEQAIGDLGLALGYNSHSHFSAAFASAFGISPSTAREQLLNTKIERYGEEEL